MYIENRIEYFAVLIKKTHKSRIDWIFLVFLPAFDFPAAPICIFKLILSTAKLYKTVLFRGCN